LFYFKINKYATHCSGYTETNLGTHKNSFRKIYEVQFELFCQTFEI